MLDGAPFLKHLWDWELEECVPSKVDEYLKFASHAEKIMCQFYVGVWNGKNDLSFDMLEAVATLDRKNMHIIKEWTADPFWP